MRSFCLPRGSFRAAPTVPGDKSLSHRALLLAAMACGESRLANLGPGDDIAATVGALQALGVLVAEGAVRSPGVASWAPPRGPIHAGNSATTMRLLAGALAARPFLTTLVGDASLMTRPMGRLVEPLGALGARVELGVGERPPIVVGRGRLHGAALVIPQPSAQVRTSAALAALQAVGPSIIDSPPGFRDHTERWLEAMGLGRRLSETRFEVLPGPVPPGRYDLPGDLSSAAFLFAVAALRPGARVTVQGVTLNPGRTGFLDVLEAMGARVGRRPTGWIHGDPVGDVTVTGDRLCGIGVAPGLALRALDELPLVAVLAATATGDTIVSGAAELRVKESDRIAAAVGLVRALGGAADERPDGFVVAGGGRLRGGMVAARGDHRIAMAAAVAAAATEGEVVVEGFEVVRVSWPGFGEALEALWS